MTFISKAEHPCSAVFLHSNIFARPNKQFFPKSDGIKRQNPKGEGEESEGERAYPKRAFPSSFELQMRWLSLLTSVTY